MFCLLLRCSCMKVRAWMVRHHDISVPYESERPRNQNPVADSLAFRHVWTQRFPWRGSNAPGEQDLRRSHTEMVSASGTSKCTTACLAQVRYQA